MFPRIKHQSCQTGSQGLWVCLGSSPPERWTPWSGSPWPGEDTDSLFNYQSFQTTQTLCKQTRGVKYKSPVRHTTVIHVMHIHV